MNNLTKISAMLLMTLLSSVMSAQPVPDRVLDSLGMLQPHVVADPPARYLRANQDFALSEGIAMTASGRIWHCWIGGEDDASAYMLLSWSDDDGRHWTDNRFVIDPHREDSPYPIRTIVGNIFIDPGNRLWVIFDQSVTYYDNRAGVWAAHCDNPDDAQPVWSKPRYIGPGCALQVPTILKNGTWVLPVSLWERRYNNSITANYGLTTPVFHAYHELDSLRMAQVYVSQDNGATWQLQGGVRFPKENLNEHMLVEMPDGRLWMTARSMTGIQQSWSDDGGCSWSTPEPYLPHINSRHFIMRLDSGSLLLVKHGTLNEQTPVRSHLCAYISTDNGATWRGGLLLDGRDDVSYPSGFQAPDGHIYICYDHGRQTEGEILMAKFTEKDVLNERFCDRGSRKPSIIYKAQLAPCLQKFAFPRPGFRPAVIYDISNASSDEDLVSELVAIKQAGYGACILTGAGDTARAAHICDSLGNAVGIGLQDTLKFASRPFIARCSDIDAWDKMRIDRATRQAYLHSFCKHKLLFPRRLIRIKGDAAVEAYRVGGRYLICVSSATGNPQEVLLRRLSRCHKAELLDLATGSRKAVKPDTPLHLDPEVWIAIPRK